MKLLKFWWEIADFSEKLLTLLKNFWNSKVSAGDLKGFPLHRQPEGDRLWTQASMWPPRMRMVGTDPVRELQQNCGLVQSPTDWQPRLQVRSDLEDKRSRDIHETEGGHPGAKEPSFNYHEGRLPPRQTRPWLRRQRPRGRPRPCVGPRGFYGKKVEEAVAKTATNSQPELWWDFSEMMGGGERWWKWGVAS